MNLNHHEIPLSREVGMSVDEILKNNVQEHLYWDSRVDASGIELSVNEGIVTLKGRVPTFFSAGAAETAITDLPGVREVRNELRVIYSQAAKHNTAEEIRSRIVASMMRFPDLDVGDIHVEVDGEEVTLSGSVTAYWQKDLARNMAARELGVTAIRDELAVVPSNNAQDKLIAESLTKILQGHAVLQAVDIMVENGVVTFTGTVTDPLALRSIRKAAEGTAGVVEVKDFIAIRM